MMKISATTLDISGDLSRSPVTGSRRNPAPGRLPRGSPDQMMPRASTNKAMPAKRRPRRSSAFNGALIESSWTPTARKLPSGKRGAVIFSVTHQPSSVMTGVENCMKYMFAAALTR